MKLVLRGTVRTIGIYYILKKAEKKTWVFRDYFGIALLLLIWIVRDPLACDLREYLRGQLLRLDRNAANMIASVLFLLATLRIAIAT